MGGMFWRHLRLCLTSTKSEICCYCTKSTKRPIKPMITVFVFDTKHKVKVTPKVAAKRQYDVLADKYVQAKAATAWKKKEKKVHPVEKNPRVRFTYPSSKDMYQILERDVRVIGANQKYVVGLEISDKNRFKKFLKSKMNNLSLVEFSPESVS